MPYIKKSIKVFRTVMAKPNRQSVDEADLFIDRDGVVVKDRLNVLKGVKLPTSDLAAKAVLGAPEALERQVDHLQQRDDCVDDDIADACRRIHDELEKRVAELTDRLETYRRETNTRLEDLEAARTRQEPVNPATNLDRC